MMGAPSSRGRYRILFIVLVWVYLVLSTFYWAPIRVLAKPDEAAHIMNVYRVRTGEWWPRYAPEPHPLWHIDEGAQSPLYYWLAAVVSRPTPVADPHRWIEINPFFLHGAPHGNGARALPLAEGGPFFYALRVVGWLLGSVVLAATYRAARLWLPQVWAWRATALLAFTPTFAFVQTGVSNATLAAVFTPLVYGELLRGWVKGPHRLHVKRLMLLVVLALYTRLDALVLLWPVLLLLWHVRGRRELLRRILFWGGVGAVATFPLWLRNVWLYHDPFVRRALALRPQPLPWRLLFTSELERLFKTLFITVGEGFILAPDGYYVVLAVLLLAAVGGFLLGLRRTRDPIPLFLLVSYAPLVLVALISTRRYYIDAPRYLLVLGTPLFLLVAWGAYQFWPLSWRRVGGSILVGVWAALNVATIVGVIGPVYQPQPASPAGPPLAFWEGGIRLREARVLRSSGEIHVDLVWDTVRPIRYNYVVFVHAYGKDGHMVAQEDTHPLYGAYPTSWWEPYHPFRDPHRLNVPPEQRVARIVVGLYRWDTQARLACVSAGGEAYPDAAVPIFEGP